MRGTTAFALFLTLFAGVAQAASLPRYDVMKYCQNIAATAGGSEMLRSSCLDQEQDAYDNLKTGWDQIPVKARSYCEGVARTVGGSYSLLQSCVEQETSAAQSNSGRTFKY